MHPQWIYRCILVHDWNTGTLTSAHKEDLLRKIEHQLAKCPDGLMEEDKSLLKCNFDKVATTNDKHQEYWRLATQASWEAYRLCALADRSEQIYTFGIM
jgi:hypothetical protein